VLALDMHTGTFLFPKLALCTHMKCRYHKQITCQWQSFSDRATTRNTNVHAIYSLWSTWKCSIQSIFSFKYAVLK